jgi:hypothetical protein
MVMETDRINAYEIAVGMLLEGHMPLCVPFEDTMSVIAVRPTSRDVLELMIHPNKRLRAKLAINITKAIRDNHEHTGGE